MRKLWREDALRSAYTMLNKRKKASKTDANAQPLCYYVSCNFDHISKRIWLAGVEAKNCYKDSLNNFKQIDIEIEIRRMPESLKDTCLSILFILNSPSRYLFPNIRKPWGLWSSPWYKWPAVISRIFEIGQAYSLKRIFQSMANSKISSKRNISAEKRV